MQQEQIKTFLVKFSAGAYTEEEHQQFIEWLKTAPIDEVETIAEEYKSVFESKEFNSANPKLVSEIEAALNQYELGKEYKEPGKVIPLMTIRKVAVAASIILALGVGGYFVFFNKDGKKNDLVKTQNPVPNDVAAPSVARATLKLDDGTIVYLDSAKDGSLALQGNMNVVKLADGQIAYQSSNDDSQATIRYNVVTNPRGSIIQSLTLSDGTKVWLNSESSIKYPVAFIGKERKVEITGEAYFEVTKDVLKKFIVDANGVTTEVLGTHFNVNSYSDERNIKVTLLEGSVNVRRGPSTSSGSNVKLIPGQQVIVNPSTPLRVTSDVDVDEVMAWKNGMFNFKGADIQTIMRQVGRWYDVDVMFEGTISDKHYRGKTSRNLSASQMLKVLEESGIKFRIEGKKIIVRE